jgi:DNA gyrase subunit A
VNAIRREEGDWVAGMDVVKADDTTVLVVTRNGYGKQTPLDSYSTRGRYGKGVRTISRDERTGAVVAMRCINPKDDILVITRNCIVLRTKLEQIRKTESRIAIGVRLMDLADDDSIIGIAIMDGAADSANGENGENGEVDISLNGDAPPNETSSNGDVAAG